METISLTRNFLKNPLKSLPYLLVVLVFFLMIISVLSPSMWQSVCNNLPKSLFVIIIPELLTLIVLLILIHTYHTVFKIKIIALTTKSISYYQLKVLPIFLTAFFFIYPFTLSLRYLIKRFPSYSWADYTLNFRNSLIIESYFLYLPFILVLGYILVNISLIDDYLEQTDNSILEQIDTLDNEQDCKADNGESLDIKEVEYIAVLKVRSNTGDTFLKVAECYYFETSDHSSLVYHADGIYKLNKAFSTLIKELPPTCFFKCNARYIVNLAYLESYVYAEKGHYALNFKKPIIANIIMPKYRIDTLRVAFQNYHAVRAVEV